MSTTDTPTPGQLLEVAERLIANNYNSNGLLLTTKGVCSQAHDGLVAGHHIFATVQADGDSQLSPEALRAMGASGGPREFWFTLKHDQKKGIDVDFTEEEQWHVWANDSNDGDVVHLAINPTVSQLRSLLSGLRCKPMLKEVPANG
jgi:hypothetical protein